MVGLSVSDFLRAVILNSDVLAVFAGLLCLRAGVSNKYMYLLRTSLIQQQNPNEQFVFPTDVGNPSKSASPTTHLSLTRPNIVHEIIRSETGIGRHLNSCVQMIVTDSHVKTRAVGTQ